MSKKDQYLSKQVRSDRQAKKLIRQGWELVGQTGGFFMTARTYTLRKPNPKYTGEAARS